MQNHFECLDPEDDRAGAKIFDYPDLFREAANALRAGRYFHEALRYYEPIKLISEYVDPAYFVDMASCYKAIGLASEAEDCYKVVIDNEGSLEGQRILLEMRTELSTSQQGGIGIDSIVSVAQREKRRRIEDKDAAQPKKGKALTHWAPTMLAPRSVPQSTKQSSAETERTFEEDVKALYLRREALTELARYGDESSKTEWMAITKTLIEEFKNNKVFYPFDKYHKFYGYSREARSLAARPKNKFDSLVEQSKSCFGIFHSPKSLRSIMLTTHVRNSTRRSDRCSHGLLRDTFLCLARNLPRVCIDARTGWKCIAFIRGHRCRFPCQCILPLSEVTISYTCLLVQYVPFRFCLSKANRYTACALLQNDEETLCNIARWFMREYQFVTDSYRLFSVLNRLSDSEGSWYNHGPSQKYILRQLKAVDFSLLGDSRRKSSFQERASYTTKDGEGNQIRAQDMDVALLMLYGHILYAGKSYAYAVSTFETSSESLAADGCDG